MWRNRAQKRQKMESKNKQEFMHRLNKKYAGLNVEKDLYRSQKVCEQLDSQLVRPKKNVLFSEISEYFLGFIIQNTFKMEKKSRMSQFF